MFNFYNNHFFSYYNLFSFLGIAEIISPVNLLLKERLVPELVQEEFTPEKITKLAIPLLENVQIRSNMFSGYERLRRHLGDPGVTDRAAKEILDMVRI